MKLRVSKQATWMAVGGAVVGAILFAAWLQWLIVIIGCAALAFAAGLYFFPASGRRPEVDIVDAPANKTEGTISDLLALNQKVRLDPHLDNETTAAIEKIIDGLEKILPLINDDDISLMLTASVTLEVDLLATDYFPNHVNSYLGMAKAGREEAHQQFVNRLEKFQAFINKVQQKIDRRDEAEFAAQDDMADMLATLR